ncbi:hypothetical protein L596_015603 [Steinernema carpocapsae]|uniref:Uncharacterized protein n=1 Tax=Steinernema carpocapsae TaxID=34508 RepID=A0A4U5NGD6_STECR|nr:hypothetical protein L596_015603 [Steinernema carpocapsae]
MAEPNLNSKILIVKISEKQNANAKDMTSRTCLLKVYFAALQVHFTSSQSIPPTGPKRTVCALLKGATETPPPTVILECQQFNDRLRLPLGETTRKGPISSYEPQAYVNRSFE